MELEEKHERVIIHIDIDCFYAQVEMNKNPELRDKPMGIQQKNIVVTCNYAARGRGVGKCMYISEAMQKCPELILVNGEDLADYRKVSASVYSLLCETGCQVERLGMDENWLDVTQMVKLRIQELNGTKPKLSGHTFGDFLCENCECITGLSVGSNIAEEIRNTLKDKFNLTTSAGIAHNKLLSKMVGGKHKPDDQTVISSAGVLELLTSDMMARSLPGIGKRTGEQLTAAGIETLGQLREADVETIINAGFPRTQAMSLKKVCWGQDDAEVKMTGRSQSIGLEDRFMGLYNENECKDKLCWLLDRLLQLLAEDGRKPTVIKVTVRDYYKDKLVKKFHKESRQGKISPRLFQLDFQGKLTEERKTEILQNALGLLKKMVDFEDSFHITLMGLAVSNFLDEVEKKGSIKNFFISPKKEGMPQSVPTASIKRKNIFNTKSSEEPDAKKSKLVDDNQSTQKEESNKDKHPTYSDRTLFSGDTKSTIDEDEYKCPLDYDIEVWKDLPLDIKKELVSVKQTTSKLSSDQQQTTSKLSSSLTSLTSTSSIGSRSSFSNNNTIITQPNELADAENNTSDNQNDKHNKEDDDQEVTKTTACPEGVDKDVFNQLPDDIKLEISQSMTKNQISNQINKIKSHMKQKSNSKSKGSKNKTTPKSENIMKYFSRQK